jgi:hypothetical protein
MGARLDSRLRGNDESGVAGFARMRLIIFVVRCEPRLMKVRGNDELRCGEIKRDNLLVSRQ